MKHLLVFIPYFFFSVSHLKAQNPGEWMWVHGDSMIASVGNFGVQGISSPLNTPPGLYESCEWKDLNGNFWLFGGSGQGGSYADLWKYDPIMSEWTWIKGPGMSNYNGNYGSQGVADPANNPTSRSHGSCTWVDLQGNLWMFGGMNTGLYSDLWKYEIATNNWTWMKGPDIPNQPGIYGVQGLSSPLNEPGARRESASAWIDNAGNLWLFGGYSSSVGLLNDLWKYDPLTNEWTWMKGSAAGNQSGTYGLQGVEAPGNTPGARMVQCRWKEANGNFWFFGGGDYFADDYFNDVWRFNPVTNNWTWMKGSNLPNSIGNYGTQCVASTANEPPARFENRAAWTDASGNFWTFGGSIEGDISDVWNDLWMYCVATNEWTWVDGSNLLNPTGSWGVLNVSSATNFPDGRGGALSWVDNTGILYLFGGWGTRNDLWKYAIDYSCISCNVLPIAIFSATNDICPGTCTDFLNSSYNSQFYQWSFPGAIPNSSTDINPTNICYQSPGNYDVELIATNANGSDTLFLSNYITVYPTPPPQGILQSGDTLIANAGASAYQWYFNSVIITGATNYFYVATQMGDYNLVATDTNGCEVEAVINDVIASIHPAFYHGGGASEPLEIFPNPVDDQITILDAQLKFGATHDISIYNVLGEKVMNITSGKSTIDCRLLSPGLYSIEILAGEKVFRSKFIKQ